MNHTMNNDTLDDGTAYQFSPREGETIQEWADRKETEFASFLKADVLNPTEELLGEQAFEDAVAARAIADAYVRAGPTTKGTPEPVTKLPAGNNYISTPSAEWEAQHPTTYIAVKR